VQLRSVPPVVRKDHAEQIDINDCAEARHKVRKKFVETGNAADEPNHGAKRLEACVVVGAMRVASDSYGWHHSPL
jgi:hypothetical protein